MHGITDPQGAPHERLRTIVFSGLWALMASAMLVESDSYRYVTIIFLIFAIVSHRTEVSVVSRDWLAILCYTWAAYAAIRFAFDVLVDDEKGTSEWLYVFPVFFPFLGVALSASRRYIFSAGTLVVVSGLVALLMSLDVPILLSGKRATPLFHHNPIHAGIGSCMLFLTAVFWLLYAAETGRLREKSKWYVVTLGVVTAVLSLIGALGAQSKGAWLALAATVAFMGIFSLLRYFRKWRGYLIAGLVVVTGAAVAIATPYVERIAGKTIVAVVKLTDDSFATKDPFAAIQRAITDPVTPGPMRQRLELWSNAMELIQAAPLVGWGNGWLREWRQTTYSDVGFTIIHNGYLEIMVRHGLLGIIFLLGFAVVTAKKINDAHRRGQISSSLTAYIFSISFFFFCTILTNSNNRLAIGESFFMIAGSTVFALILGEAEAELEA